VEDGRYSGERGEISGCSSVTWVSSYLSSDAFASQERYLFPATVHTRRESRWPQLRQEPELGDMTRLAVSDRGLATTKGRSMSAGASIRTLEKENEEY
jgi:hypothetical protein